MSMAIGYDNMELLQDLRKNAYGDEFICYFYKSPKGGEVFHRENGPSCSCKETLVGKHPLNFWKIDGTEIR